MNQCLIVGMDGASMDLIEKWVKEGKLPTIKKIINAGTTCRLKTTIPPLTPCAWSSFMTGKNPGKHGIYDFFYLDDENNIKLNSSKNRKSLDIWDYLGENSFKSFIFNVPFTYPPKKINGFLVTDFTTPSEKVDFTYPHNLKGEILNKYPNFRFSEESKYSERKIDKIKFSEDMMDLADMQFELFSDLIKKDDFDFSMIVFMLTDHAQHWYWKYMDKNHPEYTKDGEFKDVVMKAYEKIDHFLGKLMEMCPEHNIIIISDHGAGPYYKDVSINKWLMDEGYLFLKTDNSLLKSVMKKIGVDKIISVGLNIGLWSVIKKFPVIKKFVLNRMILTYKDIDWSRTIAYSYGYYAPIYFNTNKIKNQKDKNGIEVEIIEKLMELKEPFSDKPLIKKVWKKSDLYSGNENKKMPDIILNMGNFTYGSSSTFLFSSNTIFSDPKTFKSGDHAIYGIFMAYGPDFKEGEIIENAEIYDIAPTVLHMFDIPVPFDMDGRVLKEIFKHDSEYVEKKVNYAKSRLSEKNRIKCVIKNQNL